MTVAPPLDARPASPPLVVAACVMAALVMARASAARASVALSRPAP